MPSLASDIITTDAFSLNVCVVWLASLSRLSNQGGLASQTIMRIDRSH